jgi:hypothetical protein
MRHSDDGDVSCTFSNIPAAGIARSSQLNSFLPGAGMQYATSWQAVHREKSFSIFPSPAGMSLTKLSLGGNHEIIPVQGDFGK